MSSSVGRRRVGLGGSAIPAKGGISRRPLTPCLRLTCKAKQRYATYRSVAKKPTKAGNSATKTSSDMMGTPLRGRSRRPTPGRRGGNPLGVHTHLLRRGPDGVASLARPPVLRSPHFRLRVESLTRAPSLLAHGEGRSRLLKGLHSVVPATHESDQV